MAAGQGKVFLSAGGENAGRGAVIPVDEPAPNDRDSPMTAGRIAAAALLSRILVIAAASAIDAWRGVERAWSEALCQFDCGWYLALITGGYDLAPHDHAMMDAANWAFFPAYPLAVRGLAWVSGGDPLIVATLLNNLAFVAAAVLLFTTYRGVIGDRAAGWAALLFCASPFTLYNSYPYSEALFNLLFIAFFALALNRRWLAAAAVGALVAAARPLGVFAVFILLFMYLRAHGLGATWRDPDRRAELAAAVMLVPLGLFAFMFFLHQHVGDALAFKHVQIAWDREIGNPLATLYAGLRWGDGFQRHNALAAIAGLAVAAFMAHRRLPAEAFFLALAVLIPAATMMQSMPRFAFALWLPYLGLALLLGGLRRTRLVVLVLLLLSWGFYLGGWLDGVRSLT